MSWGQGRLTSLVVLLEWVPKAGAGEGSRGQMKRETEGRSVLEDHYRALHSPREGSDVESVAPG